MELLDHKNSAVLGFNPQKNLQINVKNLIRENTLDLPTEKIDV
jgi:hypothetical protein